MTVSRRVVSAVMTKLLLALLVATGAQNLAAQGFNGQGFNGQGFGGQANGPAANQEPAFDGKVEAEQLAAIADQPIVIHLRSGVRIEDATFVGVVNDPRSGSIRFVEYNQGRRTAKKRAEDIHRVFIQGRPHHLRYHGPTRTFHWIDETVAEVQTLARLEKLRFQQIEPTSPELLSEFNEKHLKFIQDGLRVLNNPQFRIEENDYAILVTDFSAAHTKAFSQMIPAVFAYMNQQFGIPANQTVLPGKAIIAFFSQRQHFGAFETAVMDNPNFGNNATIWHFNPERFAVVRHNPVFDNESIHKISMALADGYFARIHSTAPLPEWLSVGLRSTVADAALPADPRARRGEQDAVALQLRRQRSLDSILEATQIPADRRQIAKVLVQYLIRRDPMALPQYIADLKAGQPAEAALMMNYGFTNQMFAAQFGIGLGVPGLQP